MTNRFRVRLLNEDLSALYNSMHIYPSENMDGTFQYRIPVQGPNGTIGFEYKTITGIQGRPPVDFYKFLAESDAFKVPYKALGSRLNSLYKSGQIDFMTITQVDPFFTVTSTPMMWCSLPKTGKI